MSTTVTKRELREQRRAERQAAEAAEAARATRRRRARPARRRRRPGGDRRRRRRDRLVLRRRRRPKVKPVEASLLAGIPERNGVLGDPNAPGHRHRVRRPPVPDLRRGVQADAADADQRLRRAPARSSSRRARCTSSARTPAAPRARPPPPQEQGRLWPFLEAFYAAQGAENSGYVTDDFLRDVAKAAGADPDKVLAAADSPPRRRHRRRPTPTRRGWA